VDNGVGGWDPTTGASLAQYSNYIQGLAFFAAPAIADVDGDGIPDIIVPADSGALMAFSGANGGAVSGFPKWTGGWSVFTPAVGDVKGNGQTDVAAATREGYVFIWSSTASPCTGNNEAWHWHQNDWNNGTYGSDTRPPSAITDLIVTKQGTNDVLTFTAVGDNWKCGTAAGYQLFTASGAITQQNVSQATPITVTQTPGPAGTKETIVIPASQNQGSLAVRAVDGAGNIGPIAVGPVPASNTPEFGLGALSGMVAGLVAIGLVVAPRRLRRRKTSA
jgi:hypothetical protein